MKETENLQDKQLFCQDCPLPFTWTADEQEIYDSKQLFQPKRCSNYHCQRKESLVKAVPDES